MATTTSKLALALGLSAVMLAPSLANAGVYVEIAPPDPRVEVVPAAPYPGAVWQPGYYRWHHRHHVWVNGHYARPHRGRQWEPHHWVQDGRHWRFERGHWR
jgi:hypothetical protein